jgi:hypothetical protein
VLALYTDRDGRPRELITIQGFERSVLLVDRDALTFADERLLAHLAADEPAHNAELVAQAYLDQVGREDCRSRHLMPDDLRQAPSWAQDDLDKEIEIEACEHRLRDRRGGRFAIDALETGMSIPELRWRRRTQAPVPAASTVSVRAAVGALESYEPVRSLTRRALYRARNEGVASTAVLRVELERMEQSPIVLNRRLREAVLSACRREDGPTFSELAIRCGRVKRGPAGNETGETSWLARRLGLMPEGGKRLPTPWIHSDVLALIARRGLDVSPREVELA